MPARPVDAEPASRGRSGRMFVVGFAGMFFCGSLGFVALFYPGFSIVVGLGLLLLLFHYVTWGWWLGKLIRQSHSSIEDS